MFILEIEFSDEIANRIDEIGKFLGLKSRDAVIKRSISFLQCMVHEKENGSRIIIENANERKEIILDDWEWELPVSTLTNDEVLALADAKMDPSQNDRLGELQARGKVNGLTEAEEMELKALLHLYQVGQIRKSKSLAEAVRRGLRAPLKS